MTTTLQDEDRLVGTLSNGLKVACLRTRRSRVGAVRVHVDAGVRHQGDFLSGDAHMVEHMAFVRDGGGHGLDAVIEDVGGTLNGSTGFESTDYEALTLAEDVFGSVAILAEMMVKPAFDEAAYANERLVVLEEMVSDEDRDRNDFTNALAAAFPRQGANAEVLGSRDTFARRTLADVVVFRHSRYVPSSVSVVVAADVDPERAFATVRDHLESWESPVAATHKPLRYIGGDVRTLRNRDAAGAVTIAFLGSQSWTRGEILDGAVAGILTGGMTSRLTAETRRRGLTYDCHAVQDTVAEENLLCLEFVASPRNVAEAARVCVDCLSSLAHDLKEEEVERWRKAAKFALARSYEWVPSVAERAAQEVAAGRTPLSEAEAFALVSSVTREEIMAYVPTLFAKRPSVGASGAAKQAPKSDAVWSMVR